MRLPSPCFWPKWIWRYGSNAFLRPMRSFNLKARYISNLRKRNCKQNKPISDSPIKKCSTIWGRPCRKRRMARMYEINYLPIAKQDIMDIILYISNQLKAPKAAIELLFPRQPWWCLRNRTAFTKRVWIFWPEPTWPCPIPHMEISVLIGILNVIISINGLQEVTITFTSYLLLKIKCMIRGVY